MKRFPLTLALVVACLSAEQVFANVGDSCHVGACGTTDLTITASPTISCNTGDCQTGSCSSGDTMTGNATINIPTGSCGARDIAVCTFFASCGVTATCYQCQIYSGQTSNFNVSRTCTRGGSGMEFHVWASDITGKLLTCSNCNPPAGSPCVGYTGCTTNCSSNKYADEASCCL
jgi:hypothetical protein